jgi:hypothetical protein
MFSDRPLGGWGAGSFGVMHPLYRRDMITVLQPHSVPLQFLAETGIVGALLAIGAYVLLLLAGVRSARRRPAGGERLLAAALLAGAAAYAIHVLYDWDWDIPGVTLPAIVFLGVLAGTRIGAHTPSAHGPGVRSIALGSLTLYLCVFAISAALPSLAASKAGSALVAAATASPAALERAQASAALASSLDPLSDAGLRAEATIALHRGRLIQARGYLLDAVRRVPADSQAWGQLEVVDLFLHDAAGAMRAGQRMLSLDPLGLTSQALAQQANLFIAPPGDSATAISAPLR